MRRWIFEVDNWAMRKSQKRRCVREVVEVVVGCMGKAGIGKIDEGEAVPDGGEGLDTNRKSDPENNPGGWFRR